MTTPKPNQQGEPTTPDTVDNAAPAPDKKPFVEPVIAQPVDVLEATTFFQVVDSGGTGFRRKGGSHH